MATSKISRLLIIDLSGSFLYSFAKYIRITWNINTEETLHGHGPNNSTRTHFNLARTQYDLRADSVNKTKNTVGTKAQRIRHERTQLNEMEVRPSPVWHWRITILRCYLFMFRCWQLCCVKCFFMNCVYFSIDFTSYMSVTVILWRDMSIW